MNTTIKIIIGLGAVSTYVVINKFGNPFKSDLDNSKRIFEKFSERLAENQKDLIVKRIEQIYEENPFEKQYPLIKNLLKDVKSGKIKLPPPEKTKNLSQKEIKEYFEANKERFTEHKFI